MGGVAGAIYGDAGNIEQNTASLYWVNSKQVVFSHNEWLDGVRLEYLSYAHPLTKSIVAALYAKYLYIDDLKRTNDQGDSLGFFSANDNVVAINIMNRFSNFFSAGLGVKFIKQTIDSNSGSATAFDIGFLSNLTYNFSMSFAVKNIGQNLSIYKEAFSLPLTYTFGLGYYFKDIANVGFDIEKEVNEDLVYRIGIEYFVIKNVSLRGGYFSDKTAASGLTLGFGINFLTNFYLDYAYIPYGDLGNTNRFSLKYVF